MREFIRFRMPAAYRTLRYWALAALWVAAIFVSVAAQAQITKTARIELTDDKDSASVGTDMYITPDPDMQLTDQIVASRHEAGLRGKRQDTEVVNLGLTPEPVWMVFSVTNSSSREDWVLHFGTLSEGRMGMVHKLMVRNYSRDEVYVRAMREDGKPGAYGETIEGAAVPVKIGVGKTELFVVYLEAEGGLPATFIPSLQTPQKHLEVMRYGDFPANFMILLLFTAAAFFGAAAYLEKTPLYSLFSAYYIGNAAIVMLMQSLFFVSFSIGGDLVTLLFPIVFLSGAAMTWVFLGITAEDYTDNAVVLSVGSFAVVGALIALVLPGSDSIFDDILMFLPSMAGMIALAALSFLKAQRGFMAGYFIGSGWVMPVIGMIITILAITKIVGGNMILLNTYWLSLIPQALFFAPGMAKMIEVKHEERRAAASRENRAQQSLARLKQSKETADQARLLRVIERERELMAELREQEMQRTEEMRRAKEMADHANRAKSAFLAVVSHEIRTPMTGIMGILRLLKDTKTSKEQSEYLLTIQKSSDTMMALLNDILDFEKIESGSMELEEIDFDLPKLVQGVVTLMSGHAADRNVTLVADVSPDFPAALKGDPNRLRQVLLNLVNNAIKFTENGTVTIRLRATRLDSKHPGIKADYEIYFGVEDTGIGISEKAQERLFTPFEQADSSVSRKYGGTGLGLAICKKLVAAMGGAIALTSQIGVGSTFYFSLLMKRGLAENAEDAESLSPVYAPKPSVQAMKLLVIEDNEINRKVLRNFLEKEGHAVTLADSAEVGLEIFNRDSFDGVFMDINLSGMNGLDAARMIRALPDRKAASTPLVALTGNVAPEDVQSFHDAGINGFIGKPIDYELLIETLRRMREGNLTTETTQKSAPAPAAQQFTPEVYSSSTEIYEPAPYEDENFTPNVYSTPVAQETKPESDDETAKPADDVAPIHKFLREEEEKSIDKPPAPAAASGDVFDIKMLDGLLRSLGKDQMLELLNGFVQKAEEIVAALQEASGAGNTEAVYERAHELKGMAANFGMKELAKIGASIEKAAKNGTINTDDIAKLPAATESMKSALQAWLG
jgi:signal transduction histidine kinase/DNA-binding NarL/FixJ family response regulator/HPt (histidine-containing phosphotransfer) domain-containing protein